MNSSARKYKIEMKTCCRTVNLQIQRMLLLIQELVMCILPIRETHVSKYSVLLID